MNNLPFQLRAKVYLNDLASKMGADAEICQDGTSAHITLRGRVVGTLTLTYRELTQEQKDILRRELDILRDEYNGQLREYSRARKVFSTQFPKFPFDLSFDPSPEIEPGVVMEILSNLAKAEEAVRRQSQEKVMKRKVVVRRRAS